MRIEQRPRLTQARRLWRAGALLAVLLACHRLVWAEAAAEALCQYDTISVDAETGDIRFISPVRPEQEDCTDSSAALGVVPPHWRQRLPPRVRWVQQAQAIEQCQNTQSALGQRTHPLDGLGCVWLQAGQVCTIATAQAVSHAQLANAMRHCAP